MPTALVGKASPELSVPGNISAGQTLALMLLTRIGAAQASAASILGTMTGRSVEEIFCDRGHGLGLKLE